MPKLIIFNEHTAANYFHNTTINNIKKVVGNDCFVWDITVQNDLEYFIKNRDSRIYEKVLNYCEENEIEYLHIVYLVNPELLIAELNYRDTIGKLKTKISFVNDWGFIELSKARQNVYYQLLNKKNIYKIIVHSSLGDESKYIGEVHNKEINENKKIVRVYTPKYAEIKPSSKELARIKLKIPQDKFVLFYFGAMHYGKGIDILLEAMKLVNKDVLLFISSGEGRTNFSLNMESFNEPNIMWLKENASDKDLSDLFATADVIVFPYRRRYNNCGSSVLAQACQAHRPIIVPNMTSFKEIVEEYKVGITFKVEESVDLANAINLMKNNLVEIADDGYEKYVSKIQTWKNYVKEIF